MLHTDRAFTFYAPITKAYLDDEGHMHVVAVVSDNLPDRQDDIVNPSAVRKMASQAAARRLPLLENHRGTFEMGWTNTASVRELPGDTVELAIDFLLADQDQYAQRLFHEVQTGKCSRQLSIGGQFPPGPGTFRYVQRDGKMYRDILDIELDHVACTRAGHAANSRTRFVSAITKAATDVPWDDNPSAVPWERADEEPQGGSVQQAVENSGADAEKERGEGVGRGGPRQGDGGASTCVCPRCGYSQPHTRGAPCAGALCPNCGEQLVGSAVQAPDGTKKEEVVLETKAATPAETQKDEAPGVPAAPAEVQTPAAKASAPAEAQKDTPKVEAVVEKTEAKDEAAPATAKEEPAAEVAKAGGDPLTPEAKRGLTILEKISAALFGKSAETPAVDLKALRERVEKSQVAIGSFEDVQAALGAIAACEKALSGSAPAEFVGLPGTEALREAIQLAVGPAKVDGVNDVLSAGILTLKSAIDKAVRRQPEEGKKPEPKPEEELDENGKPKKPAFPGAAPAFKDEAKKDEPAEKKVKCGPDGKPMPEDEEEEKAAVPVAEKAAPALDEAAVAAIVKKSLAEAGLLDLAAKVDALTKAVDDKVALAAKAVDDKVVALAKAVDEKFVEATRSAETTLKTMDTRLTTVEKSGGVSQSLPGQDSPASSRGEGVFAGIFTQGITRAHVARAKRP